MSSYAAKRRKSEMSHNKRVRHDSIREAIRIAGLSNSIGFPSFYGVLPLELPDGTKVAAIPDVHVTAQNRYLMWAVLEFVKVFKPDIIIVIGDGADYYGLSGWPKVPGTIFDLNRELDETRDLLDDLLEYSGCAHMYYIMGNHEERGRAFLTRYAPVIAKMMNRNSREPLMHFPALLGFAEVDEPHSPVTFIYDLHGGGGFGGGLIINKDFAFHHGHFVGSRPGAAARHDADTTGISTCQGHTHGTGLTARDTIRGTIRSYEIGHLLDVLHHKLGYANILNKWHPALASGLVVGGKLHMQMLPVQMIRDNNQPSLAFTYSGQTYIQSDR